MVYEIVDNSVDEALAGYCSVIDVFINEDNSITVVDNGRGIPVGINQKAGIPAVEVVFTILHAGGKFGGSEVRIPLHAGLHVHIRGLQPPLLRRFCWNIRPRSERKHRIFLPLQRSVLQRPLQT